MDKKKLKIVFYRYSLLSRGGDKMVIAYANFLSEQGHDVCLCTNILKTEFVIGKKVTIKRIPLKTKLGTIFWALLNRVDADVVIADIIAMSFFLFVRNARRILYFAQDYDIFYYKSIALRALVQVFYVIGLKFLKIPCLAVSEPLKKELGKLSDDICIVNNGIDLDIFSSEGAKVEGSCKKPILIFARKDTRKGFDIALKVLKGINIPDAEIWVIGEKLEEQGFSIGVRNFGYVSPEKLATILRSSHVLLYLSYHEGFGLLVLESMACGCPVVAAKSIKFIRHLETGWVADKGDVDGLRQGVITLIKDQRSRERIIQAGFKLSGQYDFKNSCKEFESRVLEFYNKK